MSVSADPKPSPLLRRAPGMLAALAILALALHGPAAWPAGGLLVDVALAAALAAAALQGRLVAPAGALLAVATIAACLSTLAASDRGAALGGTLVLLRLVAAFWLGCTLAAAEGGWRRCAWGLASFGAAAALHGAIQIAFLHPRLAEEPGLGADTVAQLMDARANSYFLLPAHMGSACAAALACCAGLAVASRGTPRLLAGLLGLANVAGVALAASFSGILLAAGACGLLVVRLAPRPWRRAALATAAVAAVVVVAASVARRSDEIGRESPWSARARNWRTAAAIVREAPLVGHGAGSFGVEHARARPERSNDVRHAHQAWLEAASDHGVIVLPLLAAFVAALAARATRALGRREPGEPGAVGEGLAAAAAVGIGHSFLDFGWSMSEWGVPFALVFGAAWSLAPASPARVTRWTAAVAGAVVAAALAIDACHAVSRSRSEAALELAGSGRHGEARRLLVSAVRWDPLSDERWSELAASELALADADPPAREAWLRAAEEHARRAVGRSPRKAARHALLAEVLSARGDLAGAAAAARMAHVLAPRAPQWRAAHERAHAAWQEAAAP